MSKLNKTLSLADQIIEKLSKSGIAGENRKVSVANKIIKPSDVINTPRSQDPSGMGMAIVPRKDVKVSPATKPHVMQSKDTVKKEEEIDKSGYGPKGMSQYSATDNIKRKAKNTGDIVGEGPNVNAKSYSSKPGQQSSKQAVARDLTPARIKKLSGPVKTFTPEERAKLIEDAKNKSLVKSWVNHPKFPNADEEIEKIQKSNPVHKAEELMANQLSNLMSNKNMLGIAPPPQPTDQELFGHLVTSEEQVKKADNEWNDVNRWFREVSKPISSRFSSPEDEAAYWDSIKIQDSDSE